METNPDKFHGSFTILAAARECRLKLRECAGVPDPKLSLWAENRLSDFNLWDAEVGASARGSNSLDLRLQNDDSARNVVFGSLKTLAAWAAKCKDLEDASVARVDPLGQKLSTDTIGILLSEAKESGANKEPEITLEEAKLSIESLLKLIFKLGTAIRKPGTASCLRNKHKEKYAPLIEHLTFLLRLSNTPRITRALGDHVTTQQQIHVPIVSECDKGKQCPIRPEQQILIDANVKRHHRILFARRRVQGLQSGADTHVSASGSTSQDGPPKSPKSPSASRLQYSTTVAKQEKTKSPSPPPSQHSIATSNQLSNFVQDVSLDKVVGETQVTAPPTSIALKMDYPEPPEFPQGATVVPCPYCTMLLQKEQKEKAQIDQWRLDYKAPKYCI
ncbi:MAG: hypothetical protein M1840_004489 [Geoglossum simile]|nr:MAG: hypothetical protein M1840_004489 [Geoglossum simile]